MFLGLYVLEQSDRSLAPIREDLAFWLGVVGIVAGNFIFMVLIADRVLAIRRRLAVDVIEALTGVGVLACVGALVFAWLTGESL